jgi:alpha/beta superfamily hydrolase
MGVVHLLLVRAIAEESQRHPGQTFETLPNQRKMRSGMNPTSAHAQVDVHPDRPIPVASVFGRSDNAVLEARPNERFSSTIAPSPAGPYASIETSEPGTIRSVVLDGPAGRLEAVLNLGAQDAPFAALVCHPHPAFGGNLHNKVVYHTMKALNSPEWGLGWPVLRFNFRGAGLSQGTHDGEAEIDDVGAALDWLRREYHAPVILAGFSFGAAMALRAYSQSKGSRGDVRALVALGLPTEVEGPAYRYSFLRNITIPKLFVSGDRDQFAPAAQISQVAANAAEPKRLIFVRGADHFFTDRMEPMQRAMANWLKEQLQ